MHEPRTTIYVVRHGETEWNVAGIMQGQSESVLTDAGEAQAHTLREDLAGVHFDAVFSSDLLRARRTAEIIMKERTVRLHTTRLIREKRMGMYEGRLISAFRKENATLLDQFRILPEEQKWNFRLADGIETDREVLNRFVVRLREVAVAYSGKSLLFVTHEGAMKRLLIGLGWGGYEAIRQGSIHNTGYFVLESAGQSFSVKSSKGILIKAV